MTTAQVIGIWVLGVAALLTISVAIYSISLSVRKLSEEDEQGEQE